MEGKRKCPSKLCYCGLLTTWLFVTVLVLAMTSVEYLGPLFRALNFRITSCYVESSFYTTQFICHCGSGCKSSYPCVLVHVSINTSTEESWTVSLYQDERQQQSVISLDQDAREWCSLKVCDSNKLKNHRVVDTFYEKYGQRGTVLQCAYNSWDIRSGAVINVTPITMTVFHAVFWPFMGIIIGVVLCIIFCRRCRHEADIQLVREAQAHAEEALKLCVLEEGKASNSSTSGNMSRSKSLDPAGTNLTADSTPWVKTKNKPKYIPNKKTGQKRLLKSKTVSS